MAISAAAVVATTFISVNEAKKREKRVAQQQERLRKEESARQSFEARKVRRAQIREARLKQAQIEAQAQATGTEQSSAAVAAESSLSTQLGTNVGDINTALSFSRAKSEIEGDIFKASQKGDLERIANIGQQVAIGVAAKKA